MGHVRNKTKTNRRAKRAKTNKRNNTRKQTFRKSRRVNRGGKTPQKRSHEDAGYIEKRSRENPPPQTMEEKMLYNKENINNDPHRQEQIAHEKIKDKIILKKTEFNMNRKLDNGEPAYLDTEDLNLGEIVDQTEQLENTERQRNFEVMMDWESDMPTFGGKKRRTIKRK